jgi:hypothetical protein
VLVNKRQRARATQASMLQRRPKKSRTRTVTIGALALVVLALGSVVLAKSFVANTLSKLCYEEVDLPPEYTGGEATDVPAATLSAAIDLIQQRWPDWQLPTENDVPWKVKFVKKKGEKALGYTWHAEKTIFINHDLLEIDFPEDSDPEPVPPNTPAPAPDPGPQPAGPEDPAAIAVILRHESEHAKDGGGSSNDAHNHGFAYCSDVWFAAWLWAQESASSEPWQYKRTARLAHIFERAYIRYRDYYEQLDSSEQSGLNKPLDLPPTPSDPPQFDV